MFKKFLVLSFASTLFLLQNPNIQFVEGVCIKCNTTTGFACMSRTQYTSCNATAIDLTTQKVCPSPTICNETIPLGNPLSNIPCHFKIDTPSNKGVAISCNRAPETFVINSSAFTLTTFCASRTVGLYAHPEKNCANYIRCFSSSALKGAEYTCPGTTRFNLATQKCDTSVTC